MITSVVPDHIVASCSCSMGLKEQDGWYVCPDCSEDAIVEL